MSCETETNVFGSFGSLDDNSLRQTTFIQRSKHLTKIKNEWEKKKDIRHLKRYGGILRHAKIYCNWQPKDPKEEIDIFKRYVGIIQYRQDLLPGKSCFCLNQSHLICLLSNLYQKSEDVSLLMSRRTPSDRSEAKA